MQKTKRLTRSANGLKIELPKPHTGGQRAVYKHPYRFQVLACGRRYGKTTLSKVIAFREMAKYAGEVWYVAPTYRMSTDVWREFLGTFSPIASWVSSQERRIHLPNGGRFAVWAGDSGDSMRGGSPSLVILDEAAMIRDGSLWFSVILPALTDSKGRAYFLSTPRGRNWFHNLYLLGLDKRNTEYMSWNFSSYMNPHLDRTAIDEIRKTTPEKIFRQEYLAEFLTDIGEVFKNVESVSYGDYYEPYACPCVMGIDWGRKDDFTVVTIVDTNRMQQVDAIRLNSMEFSEQQRTIVEMYEDWRPFTIIAEENSFGLPNIEHFRNLGLPVQGFYTTNPSKNNIIMQLSLDITNKNIVLLNEPEQVRELQAYQRSMTSYGNYKYGAPSGYHDDMVMALALANWAAKEGNMSFGGLMPRLSSWGT